MTNKRGQWEQTLAIVLILVVLALAIYFIYTNFSKGSSNVSSYQQSDFDTTVQACQFAAATQSTDFCGKLYWIGGGTYAMCTANLIKSKISNPSSCSSADFKDLLAAQCKTTIKSYKVDLWIEGRTQYVTVQSADDCIWYMNAIGQNPPPTLNTQNKPTYIPSIPHPIIR